MRTPFGSGAKWDETVELTRRRCLRSGGHLFGDSPDASTAGATATSRRTAEGALRALSGASVLDLSNRITAVSTAVTVAAAAAPITLGARHHPLLFFHVSSLPTLSLYQTPRQIKWFSRRVYNRRVMSKVKWLLAIVAVLLAAMQFVPVDRTNPSSPASDSFLANRSLPGEVPVTLKRACFDCHSNETRWPLYSRIAPVSWIIVNDVNRGRGEVNFSEWARYDEAKKQHLLEEAQEVVREGEMPLGAYVLLHPSARLSPGDVERLAQAFEEQRRASLERPR